MPFQRCIIRPGALGGFRIRAILSRNKIISITRPPRQLRTWEYYRQNRTIKLYFLRRQRQVLEYFLKYEVLSLLRWDYCELAQTLESTTWRTLLQPTNFPP